MSTRREFSIRVERLSKDYRLGHRRAGRYRTLRETIVQGFENSIAAIASAAKGIGRSGRFPASASDRRSIQALRDVTFGVSQGEAVGIIGHNGAGKSTLLKILSRITEPSSGRVELRGRVGSLLEVGTGFHPELTGRENIHLNGAILGMTRREVAKQFDKIVDFAEIEPFLDTPVKRYSSGMYVRLGFSVAAHMSPDILLIDEVLAVGDLRFQRKCADFARTMAQDCRTVLVVSHNMFSIKSICQRSIYLAQGEIQFDGNVEDAIALYEKESRLTAAPWAEGELGADPSRLAVRVQDVEIFGEDGERRTVFEHGQRIRVRIRYEVRSESVCPNFIVAFIRSDNIGCCNFSSSLDGFVAPRGRATGSIELVTPPMKLVADSYCLHVIVRDPAFCTLYCAYLGQIIRIVDDLLSSDHFGVFHEKGNWSAI